MYKTDGYVAKLDIETIKGTSILRPFIENTSGVDDHNDDHGVGGRNGGGEGTIAVR